MIDNYPTRSRKQGQILIYFIILMWIHIVATAITFDTDKKSRPQRVLVLQGGGALGAYEAGAFKGDKENPLFDIVAGTSIGAINATRPANIISYNYLIILFNTGLA